MFQFNNLIKKETAKYQDKMKIRQFFHKAIYKIKTILFFKAKITSCIKKSRIRFILLFFPFLIQGKTNQNGGRFFR